MRMLDFLQKYSAVVVVTKAIIFTFLYCVIGSLPFVYEQGLSWNEAVYFMCVTMSTVGYGDFSPTTPALRLFTILWIFVAIVGVFPLLTNAIVLFTEGLNKRGRTLIEMIIKPTFIDVDGDGVKDFKKMETYAATFYAKNMMPATMLWLALQIICAGGFHAIEGAKGLPGADGWGYGSAFYHCLVTATTVGYGDLSIATDSGRIWACFHILFSVAMLGELVSTFGNLREEWKEKRGKMERLDNKMDSEFADKMIACIENFDSSAASAAGFDQMQFVLSQLVQSGVVAEEDLKPFQSIFDTAQQTGGKISRAQIEQSVGQMQVNLSPALKSLTHPCMASHAKVAPEKVVAGSAVSVQ